MKKILTTLFERHFCRLPDALNELPRSGSPRRYFRMSAGPNRCIGVYSPDPGETKAFIRFTRHFHSKGLHVPLLLAENRDLCIYLLEDLGDLSLNRYIEKEKTGGGFPAGAIPLYRLALEHLVDFQVEGHKGMDYTVCVPRQEFDRQSILWDLNHFKYYFLKLLAIPFDEQVLEEDFKTLAEHLMKAERNYFMFRDFQSRNIMIKDNDLYYIDYQGGRRGALQYDVASLLFEARTDIPFNLREELLGHYLEILASRSVRAAGGFMKHYSAFVLVRILQAMGAYGIRGIIENRALFLESIPYAIVNLKWLMEENAWIKDRFPELIRCLDRICTMEEWAAKPHGKRKGIRVSIGSFSYQAGPPRDMTGNGGGFVFDCRSLPNPGRLDVFRDMTGRDHKVVIYMENQEETVGFLENVFALVEQALEAYRTLGYTDLMVNFGCTGGRHRSVYCAEKLNAFLLDREGIEVYLEHKELN